MKPRIFFTGGSGLLALNWARCIRNTHLVTLGLHKRKIHLKGAIAKEIDLSSVNAIEKEIELLQPDFLVHTVALTDVDKCEHDPALAYEVNVSLALKVAKACAQLGVQLVHISTDQLFSGDWPLVNESMRVNPLNTYGCTKAEAEFGVLASYPSALVVRTNFYGWGTSYRTSFSDFVIQGLRKGRILNLYEDVFYTPILIDSLVIVIHELIKQRVSGIVNVAGNERISKYDFGHAIAKQFSLDKRLIKRASLVDEPNLVKRPGDMSLDNGKVSGYFGKSIPSLIDDIQLLYHQELNGTSQELAQIGKQ